MESSAGRGERSRDLERLLTFIDAIVAVAITLLVLPLVDLAGEIHSEDDSVSALIRSHSGQFWAFALSFVVIARVWMAQHHLLRTVVSANRAIVSGLVLWTFAIVFLPFPTALLSAAGEQPVTKVLYLGTLIVSSLCLSAVAIAIRRDPSVREDGPVPTVAPLASTAVLLAIALVVTLTIPSTGYYPIFLLLTSGPLANLWRRFVTRSIAAD